MKFMPIISLVSLFDIKYNACHYFQCLLTVFFITIELLKCHVYQLLFVS